MATKTLTITETAYDLLKERKLENESFSQEIMRIFSVRKKRSIWDYFGILSDEEGEEILESMKKRREVGLERVKSRMEMFE